MAIEPTPECPLVKGFLYQVWYPVDKEKYYNLMRVNDVFTLFNAINMAIYCKVVIVALMIFLLGQLKILQFELTLLGKIKGESYDRNRLCNSLLYCVKRHQEIFR